MNIGVILIIVLIVILAGGGLGPWPNGPYWGTGLAGGGILVTVLIVVLILVLLGRL